MAITDTFVKQIKHSGRPAGDKHSDGQGLYLHVTSAGKYWRLAYRFGGKQKTLALGVYPATTLANARRQRDEAKEQLALGNDPSVQKRVQKMQSTQAAANTFEAVAREFHATKADSWSAGHSMRWMRSMEKDVFPTVGKMLLPDVTAPLMLTVLRKVESRGARETASKLKEQSGQVFRYGIQTGRCSSNPVPDLSGALAPVVVKHMAAVLDPKAAGALMRAIDGYQGQPLTRAALLLSALLFQRPGNIRAMEWAWIDFEAAMMTIPAASMKRTIEGKINGRPHFVPLAPQAIEVLKEIQALTGRGRYVFPSARTGERPMSDATVGAALRRLGYTSDEMTAHGFRAMARTLLIERLPGIQADVIEAQLAHGKSGPLGAAYDRADYMEQRRQLMSTWANYLEQLKRGAEVIQFKQA
jgi:integrase